MLHLPGTLEVNSHALFPTVFGGWQKLNTEGAVHPWASDTFLTASSDFQVGNQAQEEWQRRIRLWARRSCSLCWHLRGTGGMSLRHIPFLKAVFGKENLYFFMCVECDFTVVFWEEAQFCSWEHQYHWYHEVIWISPALCQFSFVSVTGYTCVKGTLNAG